MIVSYESVPRWCLEFGPAFRRSLKRREGSFGDIWHVDEVFVTTRGKLHYQWHGVDQDGDVIDILVQRRRNAQAAERFSANAPNSRSADSWLVVTDRLRSYPPAAREVLPGTRHDASRYFINRAEVSHQSTQQRERQIRCFKSRHHGNVFSSLHDVAQTLSHYNRLLLGAANHQLFRARAFSVWRQATRAW